MRQFLLAHHLTDPSACVAVFESAMARADVASYWAYYMMVEAYLRIGNAGAAYLLATIAERLEPAEQSWHLYHCMATYLLSHGREADAVSVLRRHLEKTPENPVIESAVIESLFARNGAALPRPAALRLGAAATATVRRIPVTESSVLEMTVPTPIGGATLALGSLRARMARPAITVTELLDALVIIQNGAILVIDSDAALQLPLCGAGFPIQVLARHERLLDEGAVIEERAVASAVILKDHFKSHNVCHLLLDYMTRLELYRRAGADIAETAVITEPLSQPFMSAIAEAFGVREIISCNQRIRLRVGRLLVSDNCKATFRHPAHLAAPWAVDYIRRAFGADDADADVRDQKLYISRRDAGSRRIRSEQAVADVLRDAGFRIVASSELLYSEQVSLFRRASHVVGMHGAGLTNIVFCAPGTEVLEIFHPIGNNASYAILAAGARLRYSALVGLDAESDEPLWNDPEFPETARRDLGGRDRMNHRDVHVPLDRLHTWLGSAVAPPADAHSPETANMDHADGYGRSGRLAGWREIRQR
jgi:hypothetical protein